MVREHRITTVYIPIHMVVKGGTRESQSIGILKFSQENVESSLVRSQGLRIILHGSQLCPLGFWLCSLSDLSFY